MLKLIPAWQTSDGKFHLVEAQADKHQRELDAEMKSKVFADRLSLVLDYQGRTVGPSLDLAVDILTYVRPRLPEVISVLQELADFDRKAQEPVNDVQHNLDLDNQRERNGLAKLDRGDKRDGDTNNYDGTNEWGRVDDRDSGCVCGNLVVCSCH